MIIPVRCFTCGKVLGNKWEVYLDELMRGHSECQVLDNLGIMRYCCRRVMLTHVDLIGKLLNYDKVGGSTLPLERERSESTTYQGRSSVPVVDLDTAPEVTEPPTATKRKKVLKIDSTSDDTDMDEPPVKKSVEITAQDTAASSEGPGDQDAQPEKAEELQALQGQTTQVDEARKQEITPQSPFLPSSPLPSSPLPSSPLPSSPPPLHSPTRRTERSPSRRLDTSPSRRIDLPPRKRLVGSPDLQSGSFMMDIAAPLQDFGAEGQQDPKGDDESGVKLESNEEKVESEKKEVVEVNAMDVDTQEGDVKNENDDDPSKRTSTPWLDFNE